jgi:hypothetical protein
MGYEKQDIDFIKRTKSIIEQYDEHVMPKVDKKEQFDVTLFLNCFIGLLIVPQQNWYDNIPEECISSDEWGIEPECIHSIKDKKGRNEGNNIKNVARHLRNSIAHYNFKGISSGAGDNQIVNIEFKDFKDETHRIQTFEAVIPIAALKKFTTKFIETLIKMI